MLLRRPIVVFVNVGFSGCIYKLVRMSLCNKVLRGCYTYFDTRYLYHASQCKEAAYSARLHKVSSLDSGEKRLIRHVLMDRQMFDFRAIPLSYIHN